MQLYRVALKVRPSPGHPRYYECQFGVLCMWIYAPSPEDAGIRARRIVSDLPYEHVGTNVTVGVDPKPSELEQQCFEQALQLGIGITMFACPTGTEEGDFETMDI